MSEITSVTTGILAVVTIAGLLAMAFNSVRLLRSLRSGVLERGWKFIAIAAFFLVYGIFALDISVAGMQTSNILLGFLGYSGATFQAAGALTFAYGFKAQYDAWNPKGMKKQAAAIANK